jgi:ABC-type glycerol-3-phosphate transport system permease component
VRARTSRADARGVLRDVLVLAALVLWATPFFWQLLTSIKPDTALMAVERLLAAPPTLDHYRAVVQRSVMPAALANSLGVAALTTLLALVLGAPGAYALARLPVPGKRALLLGVVACTAFPQVTIVGPLFVIMRALELRDTWLALVLADTSFALPLVLWLVAGFVREVPIAVEEAAQIDGAGRLTTLSRVVLPLIAPGLVSAGLLVFLMSWNELLFAYTFTATEASRTVPVALALFPGVYEVPWADIAAASMLASLPPILIVAGMQRWLVRGLTAGAVRD